MLTLGSEACENKLPIAFTMLEDVSTPGPRDRQQTPRLPRAGVARSFVIALRAFFAFSASLRFREVVLASEPFRCPAKQMPGLRCTRRRGCRTPRQIIRGFSETVLSQARV